MWTLGLEARGGIGIGVVAEAELVERSGAGAGHETGEVTVAFVFEGDVTAVDDHRDLLTIGCPDAEVNTALDLLRPDAPTPLHGEGWCKNAARRCGVRRLASPRSTSDGGCCQHGQLEGERGGDDRGRQAHRIVHLFL